MDQFIAIEVEIFLAIFSALAAVILWLIKSVSASVRRDEFDRRLAKLERDIDKLAAEIRGKY